MQITSATAAAVQHQYTPPARLDSDGDSDGDTGVAAINDRDGGAQQAAQATAQAGQSSGHSVDVRA